ncbi:MAG: hypothetical protein MK193_06055, partial [Lentisphaeria bacterium]|nr:hypothetical protein [Lentisphaeria bacterium]
MILFFSDNHHTRDYFNQLITCMTEQNLSAKLYYDNKTNLPNPRFLKSLPTEAFNDALKSISQEYRILHGQDLSVSSLKRLRRQAAWKYALDMGELKRERPQLVVVWNGLKFRRSIFVKVAEELGIPILYMENGLLPNTTVCDPMGINAVNSVPRDPAFFLNREIINQDQSFSEKLTVREAKKEKRSENKVLPEHFIFVPFQVDTDTQITLFSPWIKTMRQLFEAIKALAPELPYQFVFKEHPSSPIDYSVLHDELDESIGIFANDYNTQQLIEKSEAVVTINSTVAIESILLNKRVIVLGKGFFNIEGLVLRAESELALKKAFNELPNFSVNAKLRISFLDYLKEEYLVPGSWRDATPDHLSATCERILTYYQKTQDMPTQSIFFVSTPLHLIVSLAIVDTEKVDHAHLVFIDQVSDTDNPYMTTIESWDENPFESVQCFYRPKKDMGKYKARKQLFANIEKLVIGIKPSHIYCGNDRRVEFQCAMNTAQYYDSNVQGYYMDEGTFTYTGRAASSSFSDRVIDNSIKKLAYGSWWKHP